MLRNVHFIWYITRFSDLWIFYSKVSELCKITLLQWKFWPDLKQEDSRVLLILFYVSLLLLFLVSQWKICHWLNGSYTLTIMQSIATLWLSCNCSCISLSYSSLLFHTPESSLSVTAAELWQIMFLPLLQDESAFALNNSSSRNWSFKIKN